MKKIFTSVLFIFFSIVLNAQEINKISIKEIPAKYISVQYKPKTLLSKSHVIINYGQISDFMFGKKLKEIGILKENNNQISFNSEIEAINYLANHGFKLIESYQNITTNVYNQVNENPRIFLFENLNY